MTASSCAARAASKNPLEVDIVRGGAERDVLRDGAVHERDLLRDVRDGVEPRVPAGGVERDTVDFDAPGVRREQPENELGERAFAGAVRADEAYERAGGNLERHAADAAGALRRISVRHVEEANRLSRPPPPLGARRRGRLVCSPASSAAQVLDDVVEAARSAWMRASAANTCCTAGSSRYAARPRNARCVNHRSAPAVP